MQATPTFQWGSRIANAPPGNNNPFTNFILDTKAANANVTITKVSMAGSVPNLSVIGALAYRGCNTCVTDSAVPPHVTPPTDVRAPPLLPVTSFVLKPGDTLTLLLSVELTAPGRVHVPPVRIDVTGGNSRVHAISTAAGPELCAGKIC